MTPEWLKSNSHEQINHNNKHEFTEEEQQAFLEEMKKRKEMKDD